MHFWAVAKCTYQNSKLNLRTVVDCAMTWRVILKPYSWLHSSILTPVKILLTIDFDTPSLELTNYSVFMTPKFNFRLRSRKGKTSKLWFSFLFLFSQITNFVLLLFLFFCDFSSIVLVFYSCSVLVLFGSPILFLLVFALQLNLQNKLMKTRI